VGPLVINVCKRGNRIDLRIHREPDEHVYGVTVEGDLTKDQATEHDLRLRALAAYEAARPGKGLAPDPKRLRKELGRRMGAAPAARGA